MPSRHLQQPWETWLVVALGLWALYLLYLSAFGLRIFFRPEIITNQEQFTEALLRVAGLAFLVFGVVVLVFKRRMALLWVAIGFLLYLAPWTYHYYELSTSQPQPHLVWHVVKTYPKLTWQWLPLPVGMLVFTVLAIRRLSANPTAEPDAQKTARGSP